MSEVRIASRYARAIYRTAKEEQRAAYLHNLQELASLFSDSNIQKALAGPTLPIKLKKEIFNTALEQLVADGTFKQFIFELIDAGRLASIPAIAKSFAVMIDEANGLIRGHLISATPLQAGERDTIIQKLGQAFEKNIALEDVIDPSVLGGFVVKLGNRKLDYSLRAQIEKVAQMAMA